MSTSNRPILSTSQAPAPVPGGSRDPGAAGGSSSSDEAVIIGTMLLDFDLAWPIVEQTGLTADDFHGPIPRTIFEGLIRIQQAGVPVDALTLPQRLGKKTMDTIGGPLVLHRFIDAATVIPHLAFHIRVLRDATRKRNLALWASGLAEQARNGSTADEITAEIRRVITDEDQRAAFADADLEGESLATLAAAEIDRSSILLGVEGVRYLCRGGTMLFVAPSGVGKSTASAQQDILWGLGLPAFGIAPSRPLRVVSIQAENDRGDLTAMARGIMAALSLSGADRETVSQNTAIISHNASSGADFLAFADRALTRYKPDLLRIDPLMAYAGGDLTKPETIATFCRNGLNRLATRHGCGIICVHHTPKQNGANSNSQARKQWGAFDWQYAAAGGADLANWARTVLVIEPLDRDIFAYRAAKRWPGWKNIEGEPEHVRYFQREREHGKVFWHDATAEDAAGARSSVEPKKNAGPDLDSLQGQAAALVTEPMAPAIFKEVLRSKLDLSKNSAETLLAMLTAEGGKLVRWSMGTFPQQWLVGTQKQHELWQSPALSSLSSLSSQNGTQEDKEDSLPSLSSLPSCPLKGGRKARRPGGHRGGRSGL